MKGTMSSKNELYAKNGNREFINRELSWLEFNLRVLEEAESESTPLLERLKFLAIFSSNLDEFFMVRVAGIKKMLSEGITENESPDNLPNRKLLDLIRSRAAHLVGRQYHCLMDQVLPELHKCGIKVVKLEDVGNDSLEEIDEYFEQHIFPVLTPLAVDPAHPFPFLSNLSFYLVVEFEEEPTDQLKGLPKIGFVEIPEVLNRLVEVPLDGENTYVLVEDILSRHLKRLFLGQQIKSSYPLRVTRNLDYTLLESEVVDLLQTVQAEVVNRKNSEVVRIEVTNDMPTRVIRPLLDILDVSEADVFKVSGPLQVGGLMRFYKLPMDKLKDHPFNPRLPKRLRASEDIFSLITQGDILVHHPYDSFYVVNEFVQSAAHDESVVAIKQTLYRTSGDSPIIDALISAARNGKHVTAVVELKARFDEKNNILWARRLENEGVNVVFGFVGLKTHAKCTLVIRREKKQLVRYTHFSTGNYNSETARLYTDIGLFTKNPDMGHDASLLFNVLTGFHVFHRRESHTEMLPQFRLLAMAPANLRESFLRLIDKEIEFHKKGEQGKIVAKMNALTDYQIIRALYNASSCGVKIELIVRGMCCLRPGIPNLSENIRVISVIDRFLEHSRIYYFHQGGKQKVFLASADWMPRNLDRRIEILFPILEKNIKERVIEEILGASLSDNVKARRLDEMGVYNILSPQPKEPIFRSQEKLIEKARVGGIKSLPYDKAIRFGTGKKKGKRPVAKKNALPKALR